MKRKMITGFGLAVVITAIGAIGVAASDTDYSFKSYNVVSDSETVNEAEYSFNKGLQKSRNSWQNENAEEKLESGEITQEEYDNIKSMAKEKHDKISAFHKELSNMSPNERHAYYAENDEI